MHLASRPWVPYDASTVENGIDREVTEGRIVKARVWSGIFLGAAIALASCGTPNGGGGGGATVAPGTAIAPGTTVVPGTTIVPGTTAAPGTTVTPVPAISPFTSVFVTPLPGAPGVNVVTPPVGPVGTPVPGAVVTTPYPGMAPTTVPTPITTPQTRPTLAVPGGNAPY